MTVYAITDTKKGEQGLRLLIFKLPQTGFTATTASCSQHNGASALMTMSKAKCMAWQVMPTYTHQQQFKIKSLSVTVKTTLNQRWYFIHISCNTEASSKTASNIRLFI